jgi:uncharacterized membrane protein YfcA
VAAAALFIVQGAVNWPAAVAMAGGALIGGVLAGQLARVVPPGLMRLAIIGIGALLTAVYAWRYWF